jgi:hypothetical protein
MDERFAGVSDGMQFGCHDGYVQQRNVERYSADHFYVFTVLCGER